MEGEFAFFKSFQFSDLVARTDNGRIQDLGECLGLCKQLSGERSEERETDHGFWQTYDAGPGNPHQPEK